MNLGGLSEFLLLILPPAPPEETDHAHIMSLREGLHLLGVARISAQIHDLVLRKVLFRLFYRSQFPHKSVNLSSLTVNFSMYSRQAAE